MAVGDKEEAVIACVNAALKSRGYNPPYDTSKAMNGSPVYGYGTATLIMFHRKVKTCLAGKGYIYSYDETLPYMNQTLPMTLAQTYAFIAANTEASALVAAAPAGGALDRGSMGRRAAKKRAAKPRGARAKAGVKAGLAKKAAAKKKKAAKKAAPKKSGKKNKKPPRKKRTRN